jgi:hypothetical protein
MGNKTKSKNPTIRKEAGVAIVITVSIIFFRLKLKDEFFPCRNPIIYMGTQKYE